MNLPNMASICTYFIVPSLANRSSPHPLFILRMCLLLQYSIFSTDHSLNESFHLPVYALALCMSSSDKVFNNNLEAMIALIKTSNLIKMDLAHLRFQF